VKPHYNKLRRRPRAGGDPYAVSSMVQTAIMIFEWITHPQSRPPRVMDSRLRGDDAEDDGDFAPASPGEGTFAH